MVCKINKNPAHFSNEREKVSVNDSKDKLDFGVGFDVVIWSRSFGHFRFRERGHCSLYINRIFIL
jgi:hypothetical protein